MKVELSLFPGLKGKISVFQYYLWVFIDALCETEEFPFYPLFVGYFSHDNILDLVDFFYISWDYHMWIFCTIQLLLCSITVIKLNQSYIPGVNPTCSCYIFHSSWVQFLLIFCWGFLHLYWGSLVAQWERIWLPMQETWVQFLGWEDPLEKEMATHSSILAWKIPGREEPGGLQSMGSQRVRHSSVTEHAHTCIKWDIFIYLCCLTVFFLMVSLALISEYCQLHRRTLVLILVLLFTIIELKATSQ